MVITDSYRAECQTLLEGMRHLGSRLGKPREAEMITEF